MDRQPNELLISVEVLQGMFARDAEIGPAQVLAGPDPDARIVGVRWDVGSGHPMVALVYDRPVPDPHLRRVNPHTWRTTDQQMELVTPP